ncbi:MAG: dolichyl-phosphate beta-glucosyltransferase [Nanoarchaeota archaeon]
MEISIIIPAYNEEMRIGRTLIEIRDYVKSNPLIKKWEIIAVDDGSKDKTREIVQEQIEQDKDNLIRLNCKRENRGKGFSVKEGALLAKYNTVLFSDADLSTPIEELSNFLTEIPHYDIVIGSRALKESNIKQHQPFYREFIGKTFNLLVRKITGLDIHDTQCGFKLFKDCRNLFEQQKIERFSFDVELLYLANRNEKKILEKPVTWINDERSKVSAIKDSYRMFRDLIKIRWMHRKAQNNANKQ